MKQLWLEKLAEDGLIRKEALPHIYAEVNATIKQAEESLGGISSTQMAAHLKTLLKGGLGLGIMYGGKKLYDIASKKFQSAAGRDMLAKTRGVVVGQYKDPEDIAKAQARFDEIASYAPHVAMNAPLATKIVRANLHSGISDETAQRLALVQVNYTNNLKDQQSYTKTAEVRPEVTGEILADIYIMEKSAAMFTGQDVGKFVKTVGMYSAIPLVSGLISGGAAAAWAKVKERDLRKSLDESFRVAVKQAPETHRDIFQQDMAKTRQTFDALAHFAPSVALQPHAARTFMKKMLDYYEQGGMNVTDVKELTEIEKNISGANKPKAFARGFEGGSRFSTSGPIAKGVEAATQDLMSPKNAPMPGIM